MLVKLKIDAVKIGQLNLDDIHQHETIAQCEDGFVIPNFVVEYLCLLLELVWTFQVLKILFVTVVC